MQVAWLSSFSVGFLPALYSKPKGARLRHVRWQVHTQKHKPDAATNAPSPLPGHCCHKVHPADTHKSEKQPCCPGWWLGGGALFVIAPAGICLRCLGRARGNSLGCRHQVTRRTMASCGGVPGERSEDTAVLSVDTRRGKRRRSCHTCKHKDTRRSSFASCTRTLSESQIHTPYQLSCMRRHLALQDWVANYVRKEWMVTVWWDYEIRSYIGMTLCFGSSG